MKWWLIPSKLLINILLDPEKMPIEIRELVIKATVGDDSQLNGSPAEKVGKTREAIIEEAVEKTLEIIKRKKER